jgi:hypothetical protein
MTIISKRTLILIFPEKTHERSDLLNTGGLVFFMNGLSSTVYESVHDMIKYSQKRSSVLDTGAYYYYKQSNYYKRIIPE